MSARGTVVIPIQPPLFTLFKNVGKVKFDVMGVSPQYDNNKISYCVRVGAVSATFISNLDLMTCPHSALLAHHFLFPQPRFSFLVPLRSIEFKASDAGNPPTFRGIDRASAGSLHSYVSGHAFSSCIRIMALAGHAPVVPSDFPLFEIYRLLIDSA